MRKFFQLFVSLKGQPIPMSRPEYMRALGLVYGLQLLLTIPSVALALWSNSNTRLDIQLLALTVLAIGTIVLHIVFGKRIDMANRLAYLFPQVEFKATRYLTAYYVFPLTLQLPILIYLLQDRKPSHSTRLPLIFHRPFLFLGMYLAGIVLFPFSILAFSTFGLPVAPVSYVAYFVQGPTSYYITNLAVEVEQAHKLSLRVSTKAGGPNLTDREIYDEGQKFVRSSTGTILLATVAVKSAMQKAERDVANQESSPRIVRLFKNILSVMKIDSERSASIVRVNPLNFLSPSTAMEATLLGMIEVLVDGETKTRLVSLIDAKYTEAQASPEAREEVKNALSTVMSEIRETRSYREVVSYRESGFNGMFGSTAD